MDQLFNTETDKYDMPSLRRGRPCLTLNNKTRGILAEIIDTATIFSTRNP